ncbi:hypothetical protein K474DRAFT_1041162 [Panus rudis PR-1116 ss-1]|nr:hypothetical protein K474DRAFT_1041162 [Panus rudis PR-1116 ss-1]
MSDTSLNISGLVFSIIGLVSVFPLGYALISYHLPCRKFEKLKNEYNATLDFFDKVIEEGLLPDPHFVANIRRQLNNCREDMAELRAETYVASSFKEQCVAMYNGLSHKINDRRREVLDINAQVISTSEKERQRIEELKLKHGDRSIYGVTENAQLADFDELYRGKLDFALPSRPSSIHNDVAVPVLRSVRRHSADILDVAGARKVSLDALHLGMEEPNTVYLEPLSLHPTALSALKETGPISRGDTLYYESRATENPFAVDAATLTSPPATPPVPALGLSTITPPEDLRASQLALLQQHLLSATYLFQELHGKQLFTFPLDDASAQYSL